MPIMLMIFYTFPFFRMDTTYILVVILALVIMAKLSKMAIMVLMTPPDMGINMMEIGVYKERKM